MMGEFESVDVNCHTCGVRFNAMVPVGAFYEVHCPACRSAHEIAKLKRELAMTERYLRGARRTLEMATGYRIEGIGAALLMERHEGRWRMRLETWDRWAEETFATFAEAYQAAQIGGIMPLPPGSIG